jgi:Tol biopolymer transport system component
MHEKCPYVVSELLEGQSFRELLNHGPLSTRKAIDYATQIARGLAAAHDKGITHRDIKPDNLFLTTDERVKILDFGLAKLSQSSTEDSGQTDIATRRVHTDPGTVMGTVGYMSPEQVRARHVDHRSDIFSFGAVLYEMLSGRRAFHGDSAIETLNAILKEEPADLFTANPNIAPAIERVVSHCLEKNPERRFQSTSDIAFALEALSGVASHSSQQTTIGIIPARNRWNRERLIWIALCALLAAGLGALAFKYFSRDQTTHGTVKLSLATPSGTTVPTNLNISPDGKRLMFVATNTEGKRLLWVRPLDTLVAQPLAATDGANSPFWSADGRFIGYFANGKLLRIETSGGRPQVLCDASENRGGAWNKDGVILFAGAPGLYRVSAQGGAPILATKVSAKEEAHRWPYFLPDGRHFVFLGDAGTAEAHSIRVGSLDSQDTQILFSAISNVKYAPPGYLLYVNQGALVAIAFDPSALKVVGEATTIAEHVAVVGDNHEFDFSVSEEGTLAYQSGTINSQYTWFDRTGKKLGTVGEPVASEHVALSPDARSAAVGMLDADGRQSDVWLYDLTRNTASRFTFDPHGDGTPLWSPDGKRIVFGSGRLGGNSTVDLFDKLASGASEEQLLLQSNAGKFPMSWSNDGQFILFDNWANQAKAAIWLLPLKNPTDSKPLLQSAEYNQVQAHFSPDGHFIVYTSDESGRPEIYVQRFPLSSDKWQISSGGGSQPLWRGDGKEIFFCTEDQKIMSADIKAGTTFESSIPRELFLSRVKIGYAYGYAVAPDGQRFLINTAVEAGEVTPMTVVLNWAAKLSEK